MAHCLLIIDWSLVIKCTDGVIILNQRNRLTCHQQFSSCEDIPDIRNLGAMKSHMPFLPNLISFCLGFSSEIFCSSIFYNACVFLYRISTSIVFHKEQTLDQIYTTQLVIHSFWVVLLSDKLKRLLSSPYNLHRNKYPLTR